MSLCRQIEQTSGSKVNCFMSSHESAKADEFSLSKHTNSEHHDLCTLKHTLDAVFPFGKFHDVVSIQQFMPVQIRENKFHRVTRSLSCECVTTLHCYVTLWYLHISQSHFTEHQQSDVVRRCCATVVCGLLNKKTRETSRNQSSWKFAFSCKLFTSFHDVPRVLIADAMSSQALAAILDYVTHLASMSWSINSMPDKMNLDYLKLLNCEFQKYEVRTTCNFLCTNKEECKFVLSTSTLFFCSYTIRKWPITKAFWLGSKVHGILTDDIQTSFPESSSVHPGDEAKDIRRNLVFFFFFFYCKIPHQQD